MSANSNLAAEFPLHWHVWHNDVAALLKALEAETSPDVEKKDPRSRTPLMLAVTLGHLECARVLLSHQADANAENKGSWCVVHEATSTGDPELLKMVLHHRDHQRIQRTKEAMTRLLKKLEDTPDFYTELRWEFSSWLPFVSKMCPSDTYKVYKSGATVRVDTTLIGFDSSNQWQRGNISYVFRINENIPELLVIDHQRRCVISEQIPVPQSTSAAANSYGRSFDTEFAEFEPTESDVSDRLCAPVVTTYVDVDAIGFERSKAGILGWRTDRVETVNGYESKVYTASNVELITKTRTEHLTERDKRSNDGETTPFDSLLKFVQGSETKNVDPVSNVCTLNPNGIEPDDYFNALVDLSGRDIGRPKEISRRSNTFKANLWLCDDFPLSLQEQITPIIDLMAASNAHFARLKNFIELQLPAGFPVKIEIPLFHVISARITFGNVFGLTEQVPNVRLVEELAPDGSSVVKKCEIDSEVFTVPQAFPVVGNQRRQSQPGYHGYMGGQAEEDVLLQFAIQQSLAGDIQTDSGGLSDLELQQAISSSLRMGDNDVAVAAAPAPDNQLLQALEQSRKDEEERMKRLEQEEEEQLQRILELSKTDT